MRGVRSFSSWVSSRMSSPASHLTIMRPNTEAVPSDVLSVFGEMSVEESDYWASKIRFMCRTICFCLGPSNIWRFPRQIFHFGTTYLYMYMIYVWIFGTSMFIFELGQSQYYSKGFAKLYNVCPIMSGIPFSMLFYCIISSILYATINVYSLLYIFSSFYTTMAHSVCEGYLKQYNCKTNATLHNETPEYLYFFYHIVRGRNVQPINFINWRDLGLLVFIMVVISLLIGFAVMYYHWVQLAVCVIMILALLYTTAVTCLVHGSGFEKMFNSISSNLTSITPWVYSVEQSLVTLGIGAGPLTTFWSVSKLRFLSYKECVLLNGLIFIGTILSGVIFFNAAALASFKKNTTIDKYFTGNYENLQTHTVVTEAINYFGRSFDNFTTFMFYLLLCLSCFYTLVEYVQLFLLYVSSFSKVREFNRITLLMATCVLFILITSISVTKFGFNLVMSIDQIFIGTSLIFITSCEMIAMVYLFGLKNLCDDIEFVLGFVPNYYFQITWLCLPSLLLLCFIFSLYVQFSKMKTIYDKIVLTFVMVTIVLPIIGTALYKLIRATKRRKFSNLLRPTTHPSEEEDSEHDEFHRVRLPKHQ